jgi:hypothetical protein
MQVKIGLHSYKGGIQMEWVMAITLLSVTAYVNHIQKEYDAVEKDRNYWRKEAIRLNGVIERGNAKETISL